MKATFVLNGKISLVLQPENAMEKEIVKKLSGGKVQLITSNVNILQNNVEGSLVITDETDDKNNKTA